LYVLLQHTLSLYLPKYTHLYLNIIYIQFARSRLAPESRIPNPIGLAAYWGAVGGMSGLY